jgi:hypothetical protein
MATSFISLWYPGWTKSKSSRGCFGRHDICNCAGTAESERRQTHRLWRCEVRTRLLPVCIRWTFSLLMSSEGSCVRPYRTTPCPFFLARAFSAPACFLLVRNSAAPSFGLCPCAAPLTLLAVHLWPRRRSSRLATRRVAAHRRASRCRPDLLYGRHRHYSFQHLPPTLTRSLVSPPPPVIIRCPARQRCPRCRTPPPAQPRLHHRRRPCRRPLGLTPAVTLLRLEQLTQAQT